MPDEPYRAKGLCRGGNFPLTPCTFAAAPHTPLIPPTTSFFGSYRRLHKNYSLASLQPRKLGFRLRRLAVLARRRTIQHYSIRQGQGPHPLIEKTPLQVPSGARSRPSGYVELLLQRLVPREVSTVWKAVFTIY